MKAVIYGSEYLYHKGAHVLRKKGYVASFREHLPDGRVKVIWVKD